MRGEDEETPAAEPDGEGITPACAGKTAIWMTCLTGCRDHPRMRGEDAGSLREASPRGRITPACAGKTRRSDTEGPIGRDHPRMRGKDSFILDWLLKHDGSPPHARGRRCGEGDDVHRRRITPACAGKTR